jgi:hypothetical protein
MAKKVKKKAAKKSPATKKGATKNGLKSRPATKKKKSVAKKSVAKRKPVKKKTTRRTAARPKPTSEEIRGWVADQIHASIAANQPEETVDAYRAAAEHFRLSEKKIRDAVQHIEP